MNAHYENLASPPADAVKQITGGKLKGFSDINPQWRYEALTNEFGLCGVGWKFEIANTFTEAIPATNELMIFVQVNLYVKDGDTWSEPIPGFGGDFLIVKDKNGIHGNDEGYKMAITDAIGTAAKTIGVAANVYRGRMESKYSRSESAPKAAPKTAANMGGRKTDSLVTLKKEMERLHISNEDVSEIFKMKYNKQKWADLTDAEAADMAANVGNYAIELIEKEDKKLMEDIPL